MCHSTYLGFYEKAVKEHTREVQLSEASQDTIGAAIAHRKVGECLCALKKYKEALFHQNLHLEVSLSSRLLPTMLYPLFNIPSESLN